MSRIDFTPAHTTQIPTRASVPRSADSSKVSRAPRCTPPSPPVANTRMPAALGQVRGRGDRRRAVLAARQHRREVAHAALGDLAGGGERLERVVVEPDPHLAAEDRDRRRHRAALAHHRLDLPRHAQVVGPRQPVGDDRALERDDRTALVERRPDFFVDQHRRANLRKGVRPL